MGIKDELTKAMGAHGLWRDKLKKAIQAGKGEFVANDVRKDNLCAFGKWLEESSPEDRKLAQFKIVKMLHAQFHVEAARIIELVQANKLAEAKACLEDPQGMFSRLSTQLSSALMKWHSEAKGE